MGWEERLMQIQAVTVVLSCWFVLRQLSESPCSWAELTELHGSLIPPPQQSLEPRVSDVMGSQNAVC